MNMCLRLIFLSSLIPSLFLYALNDDIDVTSPPPPSQQSGASGAEDANFSKFLEELERELAKEMKTKPKESSAVGKPLPPIGTKSKEETPHQTVTEGHQPQKMDPETLFIDPATQIITQGKQKSTEPTTKSLEAYKIVTIDYIAALNELKNNVTAFKQFNPEFKEKFLNNYRMVIETITIALKQIESNEAFVKLFLVPPESNKQLATTNQQLRQSIVTSLREIKSLNAKLLKQITPANTTVDEQEEQQAEEAIQSLAKLKQEPSPQQQSNPTTAQAIPSVQQTAPTSSTMPLEK